MDMNLGKFQVMVKDRETWCAFIGSQRVGQDLPAKQQEEVTTFLYPPLLLLPPQLLPFPPLSSFWHIFLKSEIDSCPLFLSDTVI